MNIIDRLVQGSQNVDRMKCEIRAITSMIAGLFTSALNPEHKSFKEEFVIGRCQWKIGIGTVSSLPKDTGRWGNSGLWMECWINERIVANESGLTSDINTVQDVYESLPLFVEAMFQKFPELKKKCQPLLRAVKKF